jgi:hypothetical protein
MKKIAKENFENNLDYILFMVTKASFITLLVFISKSGRGTFSSSNFDIRLKYLFNKSHLSSSDTKRVWLDRNLGATRAATSRQDSASYGDLYQWRRPSTGHEKRNA